MLEIGIHFGKRAAYPHGMCAFPESGSPLSPGSKTATLDDSGIVEKGISRAGLQPKALAAFNCLAVQTDVGRVSSSPSSHGRMSLYRVSRSRLGKRRPGIGAEWKRGGSDCVAIPGGNIWGGSFPTSRRVNNYPKP